MSWWPDWVRRATEPTEAEVAALGAPDPDLAWCARATEPLDEEVVRVRPVRAPAPRPRRAPLLVLAALVAIATLATVLLARHPQPVEVVAPLATTHLLEGGEPADLVPGIAMAGLARVEVFEVTAEHARVGVDEGAVRFDVAGEARVVVEVAPVRLEARDASFRVIVAGEVLVVRVGRGRVLAEVAGESVSLVGPRVWTWSPGPPATSAVQPEPTATPTEAAPGALPEPPSPDPATPSPAEASDPTALFQALLDDADHEIDPQEQLDRLDRFLETWAEHPLAAEAEVMRLSIRAHHGPPEVVIWELESWLLMEGRAPRRTEVLELAADLARDRLHDCRRALPHYRELSWQATGPRRSRALAWGGLCAVAEGELDLGRADLEAALEAGVEEPLATVVREALDAAPDPPDVER